MRARLPAARAVLTALLLTGLLTGCTGLQGTEGGDYVSGDGLVQQIDPDDRGAPVEATGTTVDGEPIDVASYRGQVLVVNVWGSWCGPCQSEAPLLVEAAGELPEGAAMIGVNVRDASPDNAASFERSYDVPYPSFYDQGGIVLLDFTDKIGPNAIPSTMVLDRQGRVARLVLGEVTSKTTLLETVEDVVAEPATSATGSTEPAGSTSGGAG